MKPLFVLLGVFVLSLLLTALFNKNVNYVLAGKIALSAMLIFTAMGHFVFTKGMCMMLPDFLPHKALIIYLTGFLEILAAIGMFIPAVRVLAGYLLIVFFILILPSNIYAACKHINYQTAVYDGSGLRYLWFRIPFQLLLMIWTYFFVIKEGFFAEGKV